jgi:hypothetical protein
MNIQVLKGFNARKRLSDGTDGGFAPLPVGAYTAKPTEDGFLAIEKSDGSLVYLSLSKLEEHINNKEVLLG